MTKAPKARPLRVKPRSYQPKNAELEADVSIDTTPDELAEAVLRPRQARGRPGCLRESHRHNADSDQKTVTLSL